MNNQESNNPGRPREFEAVHTTIVGGRPPGCGKPVGDIPRGLEVLMKKAAVDPEFRALLLDRRAQAAENIGLALDPDEAAMLAAIPRAQLEGIVACTRVEPAKWPIFLGRAATLMLAAVTLAGTGGACDSREMRSFGITPEDARKANEAAAAKRASASSHFTWVQTNRGGITYAAYHGNQEQVEAILKEAAENNARSQAAFAETKEAWREKHPGVEFPLPSAPKCEIEMVPDIQAIKNFFLTQAAAKKKLSALPQMPAAEQARREEAMRLFDQKLADLGGLSATALRQAAPVSESHPVNPEAEPVQSTTKGIQPDRPTSRGIQPDRP